MKIVTKKNGAALRVEAYPEKRPAIAYYAIYAKLRAAGAVRQANYPIDVARPRWHVVART
jgi:hypothetical protein